MSAHPVRRTKRELKIYSVSHSFDTEIGAVETFPDDIKIEVIAVDSNHGQATSVDGD